MKAPWVWWILTVSLSLPATAGTQGPAVLMVSVDGMKPEYVTQAVRHGLQIPFLRSVLAEGAFASGVTGVWPSITYPSHTTLITGVTPAVHGIVNNLEFDPRRKFADSWFWYASQIKVPTLWSVAHKAELTTASIGWPASVGSPDVDYLIPEYWRTFQPTADSNPSDRRLLAALTRPAGLLDEVQSVAGPYLMGNDISRDGDEIKTRYAIEILRAHKPRFMTLHLSSLDEAEHEHGPFSDAANQDLEAIDGMLRRLVTAAREINPDTFVVIVSDHGFLTLTHRINLSLPFIGAGLMDVVADPATKAPHVSAWRAEPWMAGGMAAVMLHDPADEHTRAEVLALLEKLRRDPAWGIADILDRATADRRGAFPDAAFVVTMRPGYYLGSDLSGDEIKEVSGHGGHGFDPNFPEMRAALFITGPRIGRHRDLGVVDMRQIAPTVAALLGLNLEGATGAALAVRQ